MGPDLPFESPGEINAKALGPLYLFNPRKNGIQVWMVGMGDLVRDPETVRRPGSGRQKCRHFPT